MKIFHIKAPDCTTEMKNRFTDLVSSLASVGINQQVLINPDEQLESYFLDMNIGLHIQKFSGLFDLRTQKTAQKICDSFTPHIIHTHSPGSGNITAKLKHEALRIGFTHDDEEQSKKILGQNDIVLDVKYTSSTGPMDYNILTVPPLVVSPGPDILPVSRSALDTPGDAPLIGTMIDLSRHYDLQKIFAAIRALSDLRFWVIGTGRDKEFFQEKARKQGIHDRVQFIESDHNWPGLLKALDLCVVPYRHSGADRLTLEAWSCGVPVLSAMPPEQSPITDKNDGWLIPEDTPEQWREALQGLLEDQQMRQKVAQGGYEQFTHIYEARHIAGRYLQSYETGLRIAI